MSILKVRELAVPDRRNNIDNNIYLTLFLPNISVLNSQVLLGIKSKLELEIYNQTEINRTFIIKIICDIPVNSWNLLVNIKNATLEIFLPRIYDKRCNYGFSNIPDCLDDYS